MILAKTSKRKRGESEDSIPINERTPKAQKTLKTSLDKQQQSKLNSLANDAHTPSNLRRVRSSASKQESKSTPKGTSRHLDQRTPNSKVKGKLLFTTPTKKRKDPENNIDSSVSLVRNPEQSARRRSARTLIQRTISGNISDDNELDQEDDLARIIWEADEAEDSDSEVDEDPEDGNGEEPIPSTPSKQGIRQYKKARRKRTPTPPQDLPPHELYLFQNRPGNAKTSNNTLSSELLLTHEQYHNQITAYKDPHASSLSFLHSLHSRSFPQWAFELSQSFNICLYGYGSKRHLLTSFATYLHSLPNPPPIAIVNGYIPTITLRQILLTLASLVYPNPLPSLPSQPRELLQSILSHLNTSPIPLPIHVFINSLDAAPLRRAPIPSLLAQLASSPHVHLLATCDTPSFPLLWDTAMREQYNFLFHDTTTFESYGAAEITSVVDDVNALLGRSGRSVKGKEGVGFVLRSLTENARSLYRLLIGELLAAMDEDNEDEGGGGGREEDGEGAGTGAGAGNGRRRRKEEVGVEYGVLYQKAVEDFICSNETAFRGPLKEFFDHEMVISRRDGAGTEMLGVPFRRDEMEAILEDLVG